MFFLSMAYAAVSKEPLCDEAGNPLITAEELRSRLGSPEGGALLCSSEWNHVELLYWVLFAVLLNVAIAQFYFMWKRRRFLDSGWSLIGPFFVIIYIGYSLNPIPRYFAATYIWVHLANKDKILYESWLDVIGMAYLMDTSARIQIRIFALLGALALPLLLHKFIFSRWLYPYLHQLAETVKDLKRIRVESDNWTNEAWRKKDTEEVIGQYEGSVEDLCQRWFEHWELNHERTFHWQSFLALFFLGEKSFKETRDNFLSDNMEPIRRWSLITGKEIPKW